jgi:hypothetical protein
MTAAARPDEAVSRQLTPASGSMQGQIGFAAASTQAGVSALSPRPVQLRAQPGGATALQAECMAHAANRRPSVLYTHAKHTRSCSSSASRATVASTPSLEVLSQDSGCIATTEQALYARDSPEIR